MKLYALHDKKAKHLSSFQVAKLDAQVSREFAQAVLDPKSMLGKYADDFELVAIGGVEESTEGQSDQVWPLQAPDGARMVVVITARQVLDLQPKPGSAVDPGQLSLLREA